MGHTFINSSAAVIDANIIASDSRFRLGLGGSGDIGDGMAMSFNIFSISLSSMSNGLPKVTYSSKGGRIPDCMVWAVLAGFSTRLIVFDCLHGGWVQDL